MAEIESPIERLAHKLATLHAEAPPDEQALLDELLSTLGATPEVEGFGAKQTANTPPVTVTTTAFQSWFTCLKSCADSKGQVQGELARFR